MTLIPAAAGVMGRAARQPARHAPSEPGV